MADGAVMGGTRVKRFAESCHGPLEIAVIGMLRGWVLLPHIYKHMVGDITATSARTNSNVPTVGAPPPLPSSFPVGAQQVEMNPDIRTSSFLDEPSIQLLHYDSPFALDNGYRLATWLQWRLSWLVAWPLLRLFDVFQS
jgi:hypothetical protein